MKIVATTGLPVPAICDDTNVHELCRDGAIVPESAVPGAYQQVCMTLAERTIPLANASGGKNKAIVIQQTASGPGKTGMAVWNSALLLARLLQQAVACDPTFLQNQSVLELGCGTGLVSIVAAQLGAKPVVATDGNPQIVANAQINVERNGVSVDCSTLNWGWMEAFEYENTADWVLGSDLTYNSGSWRALAETMETTIRRPNGHVLYLSLGHAGFNVNGEMAGFLSVAQELGLVVDKNTTMWLSRLLPTCVSPQERAVLEATGGAQVVVLQRKRNIQR